MAKQSRSTVKVEPELDMAIPTWKRVEAQMSVGVNGAFIPFKSAPDSMRRFIRPALFSTGHDVFELQLSGTAIVCRYRGLSIALTTGHQTGDGKGKPSPEKFVVLADSGGKTLAVPPESLRQPKVAEEEYESLQDLCIFDFGDRIKDHRVQALNMSSLLWSDSAGMTVDYSFLIGYPTDSQIINLDDDGQLTGTVNRWIRQDLQPDRPRFLDTENRNMFVKHERSTRLSVEPDGLSGSPVFSIVNDATPNRYLRFDGIVTNARGDRFAIYPSVFIRGHLDQVVREASLT